MKNSGLVVGVVLLMFGLVVVVIVMQPKKKTSTTGGGIGTQTNLFGQLIGAGISAISNSSKAQPSSAITNEHTYDPNAATDYSVNGNVLEDKSGKAVVYGTD
jgi:hypothetical protein